MNEQWRPERPSEEFGDAVVAGGALGLIAGTVLGNPSVGVILGLIAGAMADALAVMHAAKVPHTR